MASPSPRQPPYNVDAAAILIAFTFAALLRLNLIHHIPW